MAELKATKEKTQHGRVVYTLNGEKVSEKSITIKMPNGSWVNVPTIHDGKIYTEFQIMDMLKNFEIMPTSRHASKKDAETAAKARSDEIITMPAKAYDISWRNPDNKHLYDADGNPTNKLADGTAMSGAQKFAAYQTYPKEKESLKQSIMTNTQAGFYDGTNNYLNDTQREFAENQNKQKTEELAAILDRADAEKEDDFYQYYEGSNRPERILNKPTQYLTKSGPTYQEKMDKQVSDNQKRIARKELWNKLPEEKEDDFFDASKPGTNVFGDNYHSYWEPFKGVGDKKAVQNAYIQPPLSERDQAIFDQARKQRLLDDEKKTIGIPGYGATNQGTVSAADQTMFDNAKQQRREEAIGQAMSSYGPRTGAEVIKPTTPDKKIVPEYITIPQDVKPDYGKMPGFKFKSAGYKKPDGEEAGYWSADETSDFWQTDAGYEKAMQTWGEKPGWVKPGYRPKKKELDIDAIKKWFTPSK